TAMNHNLAALLIMLYVIDSLPFQGQDTGWDVGAHITSCM
ncbi:MAG: hypothetical protein ACI9FD_004202, partial [Gammaproteobacteria bacterium]